MKWHVAHLGLSIKSHGLGWLALLAVAHAHALFCPTYNVTQYAEATERRTLTEGQKHTDYHLTEHYYIINSETAMPRFSIPMRDMRLSWGLVDPVVTDTLRQDDNDKKINIQIYAEISCLDTQREGTELPNIHILALSCRTGSPTTGSTGRRFSRKKTHPVCKRMSVIPC